MHLLSPKQSRLRFGGGMESREPRKAGQGQQHPVCAPGWGSLRASVSPSPSNASQNSLRQKVLSLELLLYARHYAGYVMNISTDPRNGPTHFIDGKTDNKRDLLTCQQ